MIGVLEGGIAHTRSPHGTAARSGRLVCAPSRILPRAGGAARPSLHTSHLGVAHMEPPVSSSVGCERS